MFQGNIPDEVLSEKEVKLLIKAVNDSRSQYEQYAEENNLETRNGRFKCRWDYIFTNVRELFSDALFERHKISRGALWEFMAIYRVDTKILYILLREDRFTEIKKDISNPYHYVRVLNSKNCYLQEEKAEQIAFFSDLKIPSDEYLDQDLERMLGKIKDEVKGCINILFRENGNGVNRISGNIANYNLEILKTYDWNHYVTADIEEIIDTKTIHLDDSPKIELPIRRNKLKEKNEEIIEDNIEDISKEE